jgi:hypothetical protein
MAGDSQYVMRESRTPSRNLWEKRKMVLQKDIVKSGSRADTEIVNSYTKNQKVLTFLNDISRKIRTFLLEWEYLPKNGANVYHVLGIMQERVL